MNNAESQQIVISGVGGQGVLFITRLLADAAINRGMSVFTSETHGMAQRGGTVISHLKAGVFPGPLIRPGQADGFIALKAETVAQYCLFLKSGGWTIINGLREETDTNPAFYADADRLAETTGNPKAVNLILLGFALAKAPSLFCSADDIQSAIQNRLAGRTDLLNASLKALEAGRELA